MNKIIKSFENLRLSSHVELLFYLALTAHTFAEPPDAVVESMADAATS